MKNRSLIQLTGEKLQEIYTNEQLLRNISTAHGCYDSSHQFKHYKAFGIYPAEYIVTQEQIDLAKQEFARLKAEKIANLKAGELVFIAMGGDYTPRFEGDICNHRIRTTFKNNKGKTYFVEFSKWSRNGDFGCDFSLDIDFKKETEAKASELFQERKKFGFLSKEYEEISKQLKEYDHQRFYNTFGIEKKPFNMEFSKKNLLKLINETFDCSYTSLEIDNFILSPDDIICFCGNEKETKSTTLN